MNYDMKRSGAYIQRLRGQRGYTQDELAEVLNIDRSYLSRIESGKKGCSVDLFVQFSELFHVSLDALILGTEVDIHRGNKNRERLNTDIQELIDHLKVFQAQL